MEKRIFENPKIQDKVTVITSPAETNHEYMLLEVELKPKGGNDLHFHETFTEEFIPVAGTLGVQVGKETLDLLPGESSLVQKNVMHRFFNPTNETIKFHVKIVPAKENFIQGLAIAYGLAADGHTNEKGMPKKLDHLALLIDLTETKLKGPMALIASFMTRRAKKLRNKGVLDALLNKYYFAN